MHVHVHLISAAGTCTARLTKVHTWIVVGVRAEHRRVLGLRWSQALVAAGELAPAVGLAPPDETLRRVADATGAEGRARRRRAAEDRGRVGSVAPAEAIDARGRVAVAAHRRAGGGAAVCGRLAAERDKPLALGTVPTARPWAFVGAGGEDRVGARGLGGGAGVARPVLPLVQPAEGDVLLETLIVQPNLRSRCCFQACANELRRESCGRELRPESCANACDRTVARTSCVSLPL